MNFPRWYPTGTTMPNGDIVVQGGSLRGGPGGPGVLTPEIYTPDEGSGWKTLDGATSPAAYGDGGADHAGADENRWWYPRAFVAPGSGTLFNISGTQMFELDPSGNDGTGQLTLRGTLPAGIANQGADGNPVGATSTATMYRPGKILQVGGGWWGNGGGPDGARAGFTVDITGGTANPVIAATEPMKYQRHWATSTVLPDGDVLVTGGGRENNGNGGYVTNAEIWDPETGQLDRGRGAVRARPALPLRRAAPARRPRDDRRRRRSRSAQLHGRGVLLPGVPVRRRRSRPRARRSPTPPRRSATTARSGSATSGDGLPRDPGPQRVGDARVQQRPELPGPGVHPVPVGRRSPSRHRRTAPTPLPARTCCSSSTPTAPRRSPRSCDIDPEVAMDAADPAGRRPVRVPAPARRLARRQPRRGRRRGRGQRPDGAVDRRQPGPAGARHRAGPGWPRPHRLPPRPGRLGQPRAHAHGSRRPAASTGSRCATHATAGRAGTGPGTAALSVGNLSATLTADDGHAVAEHGPITFGTYVGTFTAAARAETLTPRPAAGAPA